jgi:hypothetical protein
MIHSATPDCTRRPVPAGAILTNVAFEAQDGDLTARGGRPPREGSPGLGPIGTSPALGGHRVAANEGAFERPRSAP